MGAVTARTQPMQVDTLHRRITIRLLLTRADAGATVHLSPQLARWIAGQLAAMEGGADA